MEYVIKNDLGAFLAYVPYNGIPHWVTEYPDAEIYTDKSQAIYFANKINVKNIEVIVIENYGLDNERVIWSNKDTVF